VLKGKLIHSINFLSTFISGNSSIQQFWFSRRFLTELSVLDSTTTQERLHQNVGEWP